MRFNIDIEDYTESDSSTNSTISSLNSSPIHNFRNYSPNRNYLYSPSQSQYSHSSSESSYSTFYFLPQARPVNQNNRVIAQEVIPYENDIESNNIDDNNSENSSETITNLDLFFGEELKGSKMTLFIIFLLFLFFIINCGINDSISNGYNNFYPLVFKTLSDFPSCEPIQKEIWRLFTNSLLHNDIGHLISNSIFIYFVGYMLENIVGPKYILIYFLGSVLGGNLACAYINRFIISFGASGGAMGLSGALLGTIILNFDILKYRLFFILFAISILGITLDLIFYNVDYQENIGYISHWFGFINGLCLSTYLSKTIIEHKIKTFIKITSINIFILLNFYLLFDYFYYDYKLNVMNERFENIEFNNCCKIYIENDFDKDFIC